MSRREEVEGTRSHALPKREASSSLPPSSICGCVCVRAPLVERPPLSPRPLDLAAGKCSRRERERVAYPRHTCCLSYAYTRFLLRRRERKEEPPSPFLSPLGILSLSFSCPSPPLSLSPVGSDTAKCATGRERECFSVREERERRGRGGGRGLA